MTESSKNILYYGDNLDVMRRHIKEETVDLVYLDPPFNSNANYNVLFAEKNGRHAASQIRAFEDTWTWNQESESIFAEIVTAGGRVADCLQALRAFLGVNDMLAYLVMMAPRLVELRRVMKRTASIYLHCDPTASHYLKMLMDAVFGPQNFKNEIIWKRVHAKGNVQRKFGAIHDIVLLYTKKVGSETWNQSYRPLGKDYVEKFYRHIDESNGRRYALDNLTAAMSRASKGQIYEWRGRRPPSTRCWVYAKERMEELEAAGRIVYSAKGYPRFKRYLDENPGEKIPDLWDDIGFAVGKESLGYPTQKPEALLERIVSTSSNPGEIILDPFCGCGTAIVSAEALHRRWIGIDITQLAINLIKVRLNDSFPGLVKYDVIGEPVSIQDAEKLADSEPFQFQAWALGLVGARVATSAKKGADKGIDGKIIFQGDKPGNFESVILSVKAGKSGAAHVRDLKGVLEREKAAIGVLISMHEPTAPMKTEAVTAGFYESALWGKRYPKIQLLTVAELLDGRKIEMPPIKQVNATFKKAPKATKKKIEQHELDM